MGFRGSGRLRVSRSRARATRSIAACSRQPATRSSAFSIPASPNWDQSSAPCSGNSRRPRNSMKPISAVSSNCCRKPSTAARCAMSSKYATTASRRRPSSRCCANSASPVCYAEHDTYTDIADVTGDFVYARLQKGDEKLKAGYPPKALDRWAARAKIWAGGGEPKDLPKIDKKSATKQPRDVFIYFIHEAKIRAPAAAMALIERLGEDQRRQKRKRPRTRGRGYIRRRQFSSWPSRRSVFNKFRSPLAACILVGCVITVTKICGLCLRSVTSKPSPTRCSARSSALSTLTPPAPRPRAAPRCLRSASPGQASTGT